MGWIEKLVEVIDSMSAERDDAGWWISGFLTMVATCLGVLLPGLADGVFCTGLSIFFGAWFGGMTGLIGYGVMSGWF